MGCFLFSGFGGFRGLAFRVSNDFVSTTRGRKRDVLSGGGGIWGSSLMFRAVEYMFPANNEFEKIKMTSATGIKKNLKIW